MADSRVVHLSRHGCAVGHDTPRREFRNAVSYRTGPPVPSRQTAANIVPTTAVLLTLLFVIRAHASEPPAINPFGARGSERTDAIPGVAELSDGTVYVGKLYLTRDMRLKIFDQRMKRQREIPLRVVRRIECHVQKEWMEKEWRFQENANDRKMYTGREYPARQYIHTITLHDGRQVRGPLSGIVYVQQAAESKPRRLLMHKRQKGAIGSQLKALVYLRSVQLGNEAYEEGKRRLAEPYRDKTNMNDRQIKRE
jgi:hypothetical protein